MVWLFEHDSQALRVETRVDALTNEYVLIIERAKGAREVERFADRESFSERLRALQQQLDAEAWVSNGPYLLSDGWRL